MARVLTAKGRDDLNCLPAQQLPGWHNVLPCPRCAEIAGATYTSLLHIGDVQACWTKSPIIPKLHAGLGKAEPNPKPGNRVCRRFKRSRDELGVAWFVFWKI